MIKKNPLRLCKNELWGPNILFFSVFVEFYVIKEITHNKI